MLESKLL